MTHNRAGDCLTLFGTLSLRSGKNGFFEFNQVDFGVQFIPFMKEMVIPALDPRWQSHSDTLSETNRYVSTADRGCC